MEAYFSAAEPCIGMSGVLSPPVHEPLAIREPEKALAWVVHKRLRHFRIQKPDSDMRVHALKKIRTLMLDPLASKLGRSLASEVGLWVCMIASSIQAQIGESSESKPFQHGPYQKACGAKASRYSPRDIGANEKVDQEDCRPKHSEQSGSYFRRGHVHPYQQYARIRTFDVP